MPVIAVVDYDMGNLHSVCKGLEKAGATPKVTYSSKELAQADAVVLPGVGAFDPAVQHLRSRDLEQPIKDIIASGKPFLGICLGLQILFESSAEGTQPGLGIVQGKVQTVSSRTRNYNSSHGLESTGTDSTKKYFVGTFTISTLGLFCPFLLC